MRDKEHYLFTRQAQTYILKSYITGASPSV